MIYILNKTNLNRMLELLSKLDLSRPWSVELKPYIQKRSQEQNARYWKLTDMAAEVVGCSSNELHEQMLGMFFGTVERKIGDRTFEVPRERSHPQDKKRFGEYMQFCEEKYISYLGVWLHD